MILAKRGVTKRLMRMGERGGIPVHSARCLI